MSNKPTYDFDLDKAAAFLLMQALMSPGWHGDESAWLWRAGQLIERPEFEFADRPIAPGKDATPNEQKAAGSALESWGKLPSPIAGVTEKQRDACKKAVEFIMKKGAVGASTTLNRILRVLGLAPED